MEINQIAFQNLENSCDLIIQKLFSGECISKNELEMLLLYEKIVKKQKVKNTNYIDTIQKYISPFLPLLQVFFSI